MIGDKIIVILGQTTTGKSELAVKISKKIGGEVISADSRQVYRGLDIGTGKVRGEWIDKSGSRVFKYKKIPHHCIDFVSPKMVFTVSDFRECGRKAMADIIDRGKIPIICGGTGFYIDILLGEKRFPEVSPDKELREGLEKKTREELFKILSELDKKRARTIDKNNPRRLIRAIEIAKTLGHVPPLNVLESYSNNFNILKIGLRLPEEELKRKIFKRLLDRIKGGMIEEVNYLHRNGISWKRLHGLGLEYRYVSLYLRGKLSREEMINRLYVEIIHYAKRQMTWFKRDKNIKWFNPTLKEDLTRIEKGVKKFILP